MRLRFFSAVSDFVIGFTTGCLAAENAEAQLKINPTKQVSLSASRLQVFFSAALAFAVNPSNPVDAIAASTIGFFLGYEYGRQNTVMAELTGSRSYKSAL